MLKFIPPGIDVPAAAVVAELLKPGPDLLRIPIDFNLVV
jgi:hypothetical protein